MAWLEAEIAGGEDLADFSKGFISATKGFHVSCVFLDAEAMARVANRARSASSTVLAALAEMGL